MNVLCAILKEKSVVFKKQKTLKLNINIPKVYSFYQMSFVRHKFEIDFNHLKFVFVFRSIFRKKCDVVSQFSQIVPCSCLAELFFMTTTTKKFKKCDKIPEF